MISIDYVAGSHGYFLEYVCNKHICNMNVDFLPFNSVRASHLKTKKYIENRIFHAQHFTNKGLSTSDRVIRVTYDHNDLLLLMSGAFLRIANSGIETNELEILHDDEFTKKNADHVTDECKNLMPRATARRVGVVGASKLNHLSERFQECAQQQ